MPPKRKPTASAAKSVPSTPATRGRPKASTAAKTAPPARATRQSNANQDDLPNASVVPTLVKGRGRSRKPVNDDITSGEAVKDVKGAAGHGGVLEDDVEEETMPDEAPKTRGRPGRKSIGAAAKTELDEQPKKARGRKTAANEAKGVEVEKIEEREEEAKARPGRKAATAAKDTKASTAKKSEGSKPMADTVEPESEDEPVEEPATTTEANGTKVAPVKKTKGRKGVNSDADAIIDIHGAAGHGGVLEDEQVEETVPDGPPKTRGKPGRKASTTTSSAAKSAKAKKVKGIKTVLQTEEEEIEEIIAIAETDAPKKRGRPSKKAAEAAIEEQVAAPSRARKTAATTQKEDEAPKRGRGRKAAAVESAAETSKQGTKRTRDQANVTEPVIDEQPKKRGRKAAQPVPELEAEEPPKKRGRPAKTSTTETINDAAPVKRGRRKAATATTEAPKRGRGKAATAGVEAEAEKPAANIGKRRGRPAKEAADPKGPETATSKKRGRPAISDDVDEPPKKRGPAAGKKATPAASEEPKKRGGRPKGSKNLPKLDGAKAGNKGTAAQRASKIVKEKVAKAKREPKASTKPAVKPATGEAASAEDYANEDGHRYWLMKAEPETRIEKGVDVKFSIDDLAGRTESEPWDGVRNHQAKGYMQAMKNGDLAFFYHSNCKIPGIVGIMEIVEEATVDESAFDEENPYFDPKSKREKPTWFNVKVSFREKFPQMITLDLLKMHKDETSSAKLKDLQVLNTRQLSITQVRPSEWSFITELANAEKQSAEHGIPTEHQAELANAEEAAAEDQVAIPKAATQTLDEHDDEGVVDAAKEQLDEDLQEAIEEAEKFSSGVAPKDTITIVRTPAPAQEEEFAVGAVPTEEISATGGFTSDILPTSETIIGQATSRPTSRGSIASKAARQSTARRSSRAPSAGPRASVGPSRARRSISRQPSAAPEAPQTPAVNPTPVASGAATEPHRARTPAEAIAEIGNSVLGTLTGGLLGHKRVSSNDPPSFDIAPTSGTVAPDTPSNVTGGESSFATSAITSTPFAALNPGRDAALARLDEEMEDIDEGLGGDEEVEITMDTAMTTQIGDLEDGGIFRETHVEEEFQFRPGTDSDFM